MAAIAEHPDYKSDTFHFDFFMINLATPVDFPNKDAKGCLQKKFAQNETFAYLGGRGVKKCIYLHYQKWDI